MTSQVFAIPFNKSSLVGRELDYILQSINTGQVAGDQGFSRKCQNLLQETLGVERALLTTSCTHALEMSALLLDISAEDEVIIPAFTFVSTANAFVLRGATPRFADVRKDTFNIDDTLLESLISPRTKAIVVVHYAGVGCEMDNILEIAKKHGISVIEDNAHGLFGKFKGRWLGTFGQLSCQSFHETKNITCGEGGALLINDRGLVERAEIIREKGTNRARFFRGQVDKYTWVDIGSSYLMSDVLAAFLYGQLEVWQTIQATRRGIWELYHEELADWCSQQGVQWPFVPQHCEQAWHMYYLVLPSELYRRRLISHLKSLRILAVFHYLPLHLSSFGSRWGGKKGDCPVAEDVSDRLLRLPFYNSLTSDVQRQVIESIRSFHG
jgi:dTDP-4-amino-4,6-dideoxygalactose transaminase